VSARRISSPSGSRAVLRTSTREGIRRENGHLRVGLGRDQQAREGQEARRHPAEITRAASRIRYSLAGAFRRFETAFAIDDEARRGQRARFRILVDDRVAYDSGVVGSGGFPRHVSVDVTGARSLVLEVLDGGDGIASDHADWLEPTLLR